MLEERESIIFNREGEIANPPPPQNRSIEKGRTILYHIYLLILLISPSDSSYLELKKKGRHTTTARIFNPLYEFLEKNFKSANQGVNICVFEVYRKHLEIFRKEIVTRKNQLFENERRLKELEDLQTQKMISDSKEVISYLKHIVISEKQKIISLSFDDIFYSKRMEHIFKRVASERGYQGDINSLKNDIKKFWNMNIEELEKYEGE